MRLLSAVDSRVEPVTYARVAPAMTSGTVSGRHTRTARSTLYTPAVRIRFLPRPSATLIAVTESDGLARKKSEIGSERPAVGPLAQVAPDELLRTAGTNTFHLPCAST